MDNIYVFYSANRYLQNNKDPSWLTGKWNLKNFDKVSKKTLNDIQKLLNSNEGQTVLVNQTKELQDSIYQDMFNNFIKTFEELLSKQSIDTKGLAAMYKYKDFTQETTSGRTLSTLINKFDKIQKQLENITEQNGIGKTGIDIILKEVQQYRTDLENLGKTISKEKGNIKNLTFNKKSYYNFMNEAIRYFNTLSILIGVPNKQNIGVIAENTVAAVMNQTHNIINEDIKKMIVGAQSEKGAVLRQGSSIINWIVDQKNGFSGNSKQEVENIGTWVKTAETGGIYSIRPSQQLVDVSFQIPSQTQSIKINASVKAYSNPKIKLVDSIPLSSLLEYENNALYHFMNTWTKHKDDNNSSINSKRSNWLNSGLPYLIALRGLSGMRSGVNTLKANVLLYLNNNNNKWSAFSMRDIAEKLQNNTLALSFNAPDYFDNEWIDGAHGGEMARIANIYLQIHAHKLTAHLDLNKLGYNVGKT